MTTSLLDQAFKQADALALRDRNRVALLASGIAAIVAIFVAAPLLDLAQPREGRSQTLTILLSGATTLVVFFVARRKAVALGRAPGLWALYACLVIVPASGCWIAIDNLIHGIPTGSSLFSFFLVQPFILPITIPLSLALAADCAHFAGLIVRASESRRDSFLALVLLGHFVLFGAARFALLL